MNNYMPKFLSGLRKKYETEPEVFEKVGNINIQRLYYTAFFLIPIHLAHVVLFWRGLTASVGIAYKWRLGIMTAHLIMAAIAFMFGMTVYIIERKGKINGKATYIIQGLAYLAYLIFGAVICSIDQLVTTSITPFIVVCSAMAVVFLTKPVFAVFFYSTAYATFYFATTLTQQNKDILLSIHVNGITAAGLGLCIALILWKNTVENLSNQVKLADSARKLAELNEIKDKLFTVVSHDIRDPLASLVSLTELLEDEKAYLSNDSIEIIDEVKERVRSTYCMVENIFEWSKDQRSGILLNSKTLALSPIVREIVGMFEIKSKEKDIEIISEVSPDIMVYVGKDVLELVLRNLISNAVKFTCSGGNIHINARENKDMVIVAIADTGVGMAHEVADMLGKEERLPSSSGTAGEKGGGLGLSICREFLGQYNGEIWVESSTGKGSTFYFSVPCGKHKL